MSRLLLENETGVPISKPRRLFQNVDRANADQGIILSRFDVEFNFQLNRGGDNESG
mgnify:CR=1 FL=1